MKTIDVWETPKMNEAVPNFGEALSEPKLSAENLTYHSGDTEFSKQDFVNAVAPYFTSLKNAGRTRFLCAFTYGNDDKTNVTGYSSDKTINVTNNTNVLKSRATNGRWVVYELKS